MTKLKIFKLSNKVLSQEHIKALRRSFKFTPTPIPKKIQLRKDVHLFSRKLRLLEMFYTEIDLEEGKSSYYSIRKNKSASIPPRWTAIQARIDGYTRFKE